MEDRDLNLDLADSGPVLGASVAWSTLWPFSKVLSVPLLPTTCPPESCKKGQEIGWEGCPLSSQDALETQDMAAVTSAHEALYHSPRASSSSPSHPSQPRPQWMG